MAGVTVRESQNVGGRILGRVVRGETLVVTRDGEPIAELRPSRRTALRADILLARWRQMSTADAARMRVDLDAVLDAAV